MAGGRRRAVRRGRPARPARPGPADDLPRRGGDARPAGRPGRPRGEGDDHPFPRGRGGEGRRPRRDPA
ncbi:hypothetical protein F5972_18795 [Microbispora cellulosiformans]|uniref:Uncharacterized protein n=1 Tax=Microbispora cellulosiformans TaxID=2614688 RepID=A0A5J5K3Q9_9ACTN|nr:hypothetical protein F5972_18795 [Microbispora cellulosiformans]